MMLILVPGRAQIEAAFKDTTADIIKLIDQQIGKANDRGKTVSVRCLATRHTPSAFCFPRSR